jgi:SNF2 family DNA or RNA helicase
MGLGKTHQTMAFLLSLYEEGAQRPSLVVAPTSVLDPWIQKMREFAPALRPYRYYGPNRKPEILRLPGQRVIVTTYSVLIRDIAQLAALDWECAVLDEAQYIKTSSTQYARAAKQLHAGTRIALTGTPIENRLDELWSIFDFILPGYLGSGEKFRELYEIPIVKEQDAVVRDELKRRIAPFKLRRVKSEVLQDLPPKVEDVRMCDLSEHQAVLYRTIVQKDGEALADELRNTSRKVDYVSVFAALSKLKRVCDHPALLVPGGRARDLQSGKFDVFRELMDEALGSGQKVVVFTQYLEMMDIIEDHLRSLRVPFSEIRGDTRDRAEAMRVFNKKDECRVFVCSLMAGGVGIDLTSASVVIHYDRWWNAAREDQATDRVHRWGQRRGVQVFKLVTRGTLEEKIDRMIAIKGELMNSIVDVDAGAFHRFDREELIELLTGHLTEPADAAAVRALAAGA